MHRNAAELTAKTNGVPQEDTKRTINLADVLAFTYSQVVLYCFVVYFPCCRFISEQTHVKSSSMVYLASRFCGNHSSRGISSTDVE